MKMIGIVALGVLALGDRCASTQVPKEHASKRASRESTPVAATGRPHLARGEVLVVGHSEPLRLGSSEPPCGEQACGNATRDTCVIAQDDYDAEVYDAESCDGLDLGGASCRLLGYVGGELACSAGCEWDLSGCEVCPPGECVTHRIANGDAQLQSLALASDGQRVLLTWSTRERREGVMKECLYTAFEDEPMVPQPQLCTVLGWPMYVRDIHMSDNAVGWQITASLGGKRWGAQLDPDGNLVGEGVQTDEAFPPESCSTSVDVGAAEFRVTPETPRLGNAGAAPLVGGWYVDGEPKGEPIQVARDPLATSCIVGTAVGDTFVLGWLSVHRGLMIRHLPLPRFAFVPPRQDR